MKYIEDCSEIIKEEFKIKEKDYEKKLKSIT